MPIAETIAIGSLATSAATGAASGIASMFGDDKNPNRLSFGSPTLGFQFVNQMQSQIQQLQTEYDQMIQLEQTLRDRLTVQQDYIKGLIPKPAAARALALQDQQISKAFGGRTLEQIGQGFLDDEDKALSDKLTQATNEEVAKLRGGGEGVDTDPALEGQLVDAENELRRGLIQQLGPGYETTTAGQNALQEFNKRKLEARYTARQDLVDRAHTRAAQRIGILGSGYEEASMIRNRSRQTGLAEVALGNEIRKGTLDRARQGALDIAGLETQRFEAGTNAAQVRAGLLGQQRQVQTLLGTTDLDRTTRRALDTGVVGPGSIYDQTGGKFTPSTLADYTNYVEGRDNAAAQGYLTNQPGYQKGIISGSGYATPKSILNKKTLY